MKTTKKLIVTGALALLLTAGIASPAQAVKATSVATGGASGGAQTDAAMACSLLPWLPWCW